MLGVLVLAAGCSRQPAGLGLRACPYVRPRLVRIDRDVIQSATADAGAVAQDFALYVEQLPDGGKAKADRQLVRFAAALRAATQPGADHAGLGALAPTESALKQRCNIAA